VRKPSRRIFQIACERVGVAPEESVLVDDVERNLSGAARLGIRGVLHVEASRTIDGLSALFGLDLRAPDPDPRPGGLTR
jgi:putative hydrolase of the HAD superfamily